LDENEATLKLIKDLIEVLEEADQPVSDELRELLHNTQVIQRNKNCSKGKIQETNLILDVTIKGSKEEIFITDHFKGMKMMIFMEGIKDILEIQEILIEKIKKMMIIMEIPEIVEIIKEMEIIIMITEEITEGIKEILMAQAEEKTDTIGKENSKSFIVKSILLHDKNILEI